MEGYSAIAVSDRSSAGALCRPLHVSNGLVKAAGVCSLYLFCHSRFLFQVLTAFLVACTSSKYYSRDYTSTGTCSCTSCLAAVAAVEVPFANTTRSSSSSANCGRNVSRRGRRRKGRKRKCRRRQNEEVAMGRWRQQQ